jgi:hypothetical protein
MCQTSARGSAFSSANPDFPGAVAFIVTITSFSRMLLDVGSISERQKNTLSFILSLRTLWRICSSGYFLSAMSNEGRRWPIIAIATVLLNLLISWSRGRTSNPLSLNMSAWPPPTQRKKSRCLRYCLRGGSACGN